jgi:hypothetical protein
MDIAGIIGLPFQIKFIEINGLRLREIESTLNSTNISKSPRLGKRPVEENTAEIGVLGGHFLDELRDLVQI